MAIQQQPLSTSSPIPTEETGALISSDKVAGTSVFRPTGEMIGRVESVMIDKRSGQVAYAVLSFGGFLGVSEHHYPLPWSLLAYDAVLGGYKVDLSEAQLKDAPHYAAGDSWDWENPEQDRQVKKHFNWVFI